MMDDALKIDGTKLDLHPHRVAQWLDSTMGRADPLNVAPIYIEVSPVGACNHRCTFCAVDYVGYKSIQLDAHVMTDRLHEMAGMGVKSIMFAGEGEPLLHKRINELNASAQSAGLDTAFTTNGVLLDKLSVPGTTWIKVSVNAGTAESYAKIHRTHERDWARVWRNIERTARTKGACTLGVQCLMLPEIAHEADALARRARDAGCDYLVIKPYSQHRFSHTHEYENADTRVWDAIDLRHLETDAFAVHYRAESAATKAIPYQRCHATPFLWAYVMASGDLYSCSAYLLDERFKLGNINEQTFRDIWHGEKRRKHIEYVREHLDIHECRVNCRMSAANKYMESFFTQPHKNFI